MIREKTAIKYAKALKEYCELTRCHDCPFCYYNINREVSCKLEFKRPSWWRLSEENERR